MTATVKLDRALGFFDTSLLGISGVLGSGMFILLASILKNAGNLSIFAILLAAIPNLLAALSYAELGAMYQRNDVESYSVKEAFGDNAQHVMTTLLVVFLFFNTAPLFIFGAEMITSTYAKAVIIASIIICGIINYYGIELSSNLNNIIIVISVSLFIALSASSFAKNNVNNLFKSQSSMPTPMSFLIAASMSLFLFTGYDVVVKMSQEIQDPGKNIHRSIITTVIVCTVVYFALTLACQISPIFKSIAKSSRPLSELSSQLWGTSVVTTAISLAVVFGCAFVSTISLSRYLYSISGNYVSANNPMTYLDPKHKTPVYAILVSSIILIVISMCGTGPQIALFACMFFMFLLCVLHGAVIALRIQRPDANRPFKIPFSIGNIPISSVLGIIISLFFAGVILYQKLSL